MVNLERSQAYNKRLKADRLEKSHEVASRLFQWSIGSDKSKGTVDAALSANKH